MHVVCKYDECAGTTKCNVINEHHRVTSNYHCDILRQAWNAQYNIDMIYYWKMRRIHKNMYIKYHILNDNNIHLTTSVK